MKTLARLVLAFLRGKSPLYHLFLQDRRVLDLGCGPGKLGGHAPEAYVGVDISREMLEGARRAGLRVVAGDVACLAFKAETFDAVNCAQIIEHLAPEAAARMIREACRVLRPGGILLIRSPMPANVWNTFSHIRPYPPAAIRKLLKTETESYLREGTAIAFQEDFVLYYGPVVRPLPLQALGFLWALCFSPGRSGYAMVLRKSSASARVR